MKKIVAVAVALILTSQVFAQDYSSLHKLVIKFYGYQRAGLKSGDNGNLNKMNVHKGDVYKGNALDGGWYDAGDYIKFGMPLSYTVYCLLKGYDIWPSSYEDNYDMTYGGKDKIPDILNEVKFATDYLMKAVINENTIILDVGRGEGDGEHGPLDGSVPNSGGRTRDDQIFTCTGADIPATYAACLALMSTLYRKHDKDYADKCLEKAIVAFKFAKKKYDAGQEFCKPQPGGFYTYDDGNGNGNEYKNVNERLVAAGVELYRAAKEDDPNMSTYESWAKKGIVAFSTNMGYSFIGPLAAFEVWRQGLGSAGALAQNIGFITGYIKKSGTFEGVYQNSGWGTARDASTAAMEFGMAYVTSSDKSTRDKYYDYAKDHVAWVTGSCSYNNYNGGKTSFVVGYGNNYPKGVHYRPTTSGPKGGVVSGPNPEGEWRDGSSEYQFTEVALDYNAGIVGAVAFLKAVSSGGSLVTDAFSISPSEDIDLSSGKVTFKASFSESVEWKVVVKGGCGTKTFSGTGKSINEAWDGSADEGFFLGGETVVARLEIDKDIPAMDIVNVKAKTFRIDKVKKLSAGSKDVLIANFEEDDSVNVLGGKWTPFTTMTSPGHKTKLSYTEEDGSKVIAVKCRVISDAPSLNSGVRVTFNSGGKATAIGGAKTIVFDCKVDKVGYNMRVELEQANILDTAYYGMVVPVKTAMNSYRLDISKFTQPDWKSSDAPLDLNNIVAIRFTFYDSAESFINLYMDNIYIDELVPGNTKMSPKLVSESFKPVVFNKQLTYNWLPTLAGKGAVDVSIFNIAGKLMLKKSLNSVSGKPVSVHLTGLSTGIYTAIHTLNGKKVGQNFKLTICD